MLIKYRSSVVNLENVFSFEIAETGSGDWKLLKFVSSGDQTKCFSFANSETVKIIIELISDTHYSLFDCEKYVDENGLILPRFQKSNNGQ